MKRANKEQVAAIKQKILDFCTDYKTTMEISQHLGMRPQYVFSYCDHLKENRFLERINGRSSNNNNCFYFKTLIPTFREIRLNESTEHQEKRWHWIPVGFMSQQVIEHKVQGKKHRIDDPERAEQLKLAEQKRREERKKQATKGVFVSGSTLHMAV